MWMKNWRRKKLNLNPIDKILYSIGGFCGKNAHTGSLSITDFIRDVKNENQIDVLKEMIQKLINVTSKQQ